MPTNVLCFDSTHKTTSTSCAEGNTFGTFIQGTTRPLDMSDENAWSVEEAISNLKNAMNESNHSASDVFSSIDTNGDGEINGPELYKGLLEHLGDALSPGQVSMIIKALDANEDNRIDLSELTAALEEEE
jgi:Ca2+-binding EF-hand superfamily protein